MAINISNCVAGGGLQIGTWFVQNAIRRRTELPFDICLVINDCHRSRLDIPGDLELPGALISVPKSPMRSWAAKREIQAFLERSECDCLLSLFGPSGLRHPLQITGIANAFVTSNELDVIRGVFPKSWPLQMARYWWFGRMASASKHLIFETEGERDRYAARWRYPLDQTTVIGNSVNDVFVTSEVHSRESQAPATCPRILFVTGDHPHKNNHMIPAYVAALRKHGLEKFKLALTLGPEWRGRWDDNVEIDDAVELLGTLDPQRLWSEYAKATFVAHPSSFETYSAVYNEVRFARRALLASHCRSALEICRDFAHFFDPLDSDSFAVAALRLLSNLAEAERLSWESRRSVLMPEEKFDRVISVIVEVLERRSRDPKQSRREVVLSR